MQKIFIVEDDENIRGMMEYALGSAGFSADSFCCASDFWAAIRKNIPALILLDIMLPEEDGIEILRKLKNSPAWSKIPVIMLTAKSTEYDKIKGLDLGADDYVGKPFSVLEVLSRIKAVLRRTEEIVSQPKVFVLGELRLQEDRRSVTVGEEDILLTYKEFELLLYLMEHEGIVLSREKLLQNIWGFDYQGESRTVDMHIRTLRQKLGDAGNYIKTVRNVGYKIGG